MPKTAVEVGSLLDIETQPVLQINCINHVFYSIHIYIKNPFTVPDQPDQEKNNNNTVNVTLSLHNSYLKMADYITFWPISSTRVDQ